MNDVAQMTGSRPLRCATAGSVDDGKSTLIGRLLLDAKALMSDQLSQVEEASRRRGFARTELALVTDGLRAEREQGITIDVAWRYFATPKRRFVLADSPGHVQYTRNMVTAASQADVAIILIDARRGVVEQTRRHLFVARLLGLRDLVVAVNKMDAVGFDHAVYARIRDDVTAFCRAAGVPGPPARLAFFPVSALAGDNVVTPSRATPWYDGPALLAYLESLAPEEERAGAPLRFPVQWVIRPQSAELPDYRGYAGRVASGTLRPGREVRVLPGGAVSRVARVESYGTDLDSASAGRSVVVHLADDLDVSRGDMLIAEGEPAPRLTREFVADLAWVSERRADVGAPYVVLHTTREVRARLEAVDFRYDVTSGEALPAGDTPLALNDLARVRIRVAEPLALDAYEACRATGSFLLVDPATGDTLAAGMVR